MPRLRYRQSFVISDIRKFPWGDRISKCEGRYVLIIEYKKRPQLYRRYGLNRRENISMRLKHSLSGRTISTRSAFSEAEQAERSHQSRCPICKAEARRIHQHTIHVVRRVNRRNQISILAFLDHSLLLCHP